MEMLHNCPISVLVHVHGRTSRHSAADRQTTTRPVVILNEASGAGHAASLG